jgi:hypothetical protein
MSSFLETILEPITGSAKGSSRTGSPSGSAASSVSSMESDGVNMEAMSPRALTPIEVEIEAPEGWQEGVPKPWTMRDPVYDKPLPVPTRTPSPMLSAQEKNKKPSEPHPRHRHIRKRNQEGQGEDVAVAVPGSVSGEGAAQAASADQELRELLMSPLKTRRTPPVFTSPQPASSLLYKDQGGPTEQSKYQPGEEELVTAGAGNQSAEIIEGLKGTERGLPGVETEKQAIGQGQEPIEQGGDVLVSREAELETVQGEGGLSARGTFFAATQFHAAHKYPDSEEANIGKQEVGEETARAIAPQEAGVKEAPVSPMTGAVGTAPDQGVTVKGAAREEAGAIDRLDQPHIHEDGRTDMEAGISQTAGKEEAVLGEANAAQDALVAEATAMEEVDLNASPGTDQPLIRDGQSEEQTQKSTAQPSKIEEEKQPEAQSWLDRMRAKRQRDAQERQRRRTVPGVTEAFVPSAWKQAAAPVSEIDVPVAGSPRDTTAPSSRASPQVDLEEGPRLTSLESAGLIRVMPAAGEKAVQGKLMLDPNTGLITTAFRRGNKQDWQVQRGHFVDEFFEPSLFDEGARSVWDKSPPKVEWRRGRKDDWQASRKYPVDQFFEPSLFEDPVANMSLDELMSRRPLPSPPPVYRRGSKQDWQVQREYFVDEFFEPSLFDEGQPTSTAEDRTEGLKSTIPRVCRRGQKDDWQVDRQYPVDEFFEPSLFMEASLTAISVGDAMGMVATVSMDKGEGVRGLVEEGPRRYRRGNKDDWQTTRRHGIDRFFEPQLFFKRTRVLSPGEGLRRDWRTQRPFSVTHFFNPHLFDEPPRPLISLFDHYRQDWQTPREHFVDEFFEPSLFDEPSSSSLASFLSASQDQPLAGLDSKRRLATPLQKDQDKRFRLDESSQTEGEVCIQEPAQMTEEQIHRDTSEYEVEDKTTMAEDKTIVEDKTMVEGKTIIEDRTMVEDEAEGEVKDKYEDEDKHVDKGREEPKDEMIIREDMSPREAADVLFARLQQELSSTPSSVPSGAIPSDEADEMMMVSDEEEAIRMQITEERARQAWGNFLEATASSTLDPDFLMGHLLAANGIPAELRTAVYVRLAGGDAVLSGLVQLYPVLLEQVLPPSNDVQLRLDSLLLEDEDEEAEADDDNRSAAVHRVLTAYSRYDPVLGFSPSMVPVVRSLLETPGMLEPVAFALTARLAFAYGWRGLLIPGLEGCVLEDGVVDRLLRGVDPGLTEHLNTLGISAQAWHAASQHLSTLGRGSAVCLDGTFLAGLGFLHSALLHALAERRERLLSLDEGDAVVDDLWHAIDLRIVDYSTLQGAILSAADYAEAYYAAHAALQSARSLRCQQENDVVHLDNQTVLRAVRELHVLVSNVLLDRAALVQQVEEQRLCLHEHLEAEAVMSARIHQLECVVASTAASLDDTKSVPAVDEDEALAPKQASPQQDRPEGAAA